MCGICGKLNFDWDKKSSEITANSSRRIVSKNGKIVRITPII